MGDINLYRPDGKVYVFRNTGLSYITDADVSEQLEGLADGWKYMTANDDIEWYDSSGKLLSITSRTGLSQQLSYNASGLLISVTDTFGREVTFSYDAQNRISTITDPAGGVYSYTYNAGHYLTAVTYPDGKSRSYLYEDAIFPYILTGIVDENGNRYATWSYDSQRRALTSEHAGGVEKVTLTYNTDGSTQVTDTLGATSIYRFQTILGVVKNTRITRTCSSCVSATATATYDPNGNLASRTDFNGITTTYTYDLTRNLETSRTEASGTAQARTITTEWHPTYRLPTKIIAPGRTTTFSYDASGNLLQKTLSAGATSRTWTYTYNTFGQVLTADGPRTDVNDLTTYTYDSLGNLSSLTNALGHVTQITAYDAHGKPLTLIDPNGLTTTFSYDARGRLTARTIGSETTTFLYDGVGQLLQVTLPDGSRYHYTYDAAHRLTDIQDPAGNRLHYTLDLMGNRLKEDIFDSAGTLSQTRSRLFNALSRLTQDLGAQNQTTSYSYDNNGNRLSHTDPLNAVSHYSYDPLNRLTQITDALNGITTYTYDAQDRLTQVADPKGGTTTYGYDGLGNLLSLSSPDSGISRYTYDEAGNLKTHTDARLATTGYQYDAQGRLTQVTYADGSSAIYTYDQGQNGKGRLTQLTDNTSTTTWSYDSQGRLTQKQQTLGTVNASIRYQYDSLGRLSQMTYPSGMTLGYTYTHGQITSLTVNGQPALTNISYQPFGPVTGWTLSSGGTYTRTLDQDGQMTQHTLGQSSRTLSYDAAGRLTALSDPTTTFNYDYDALSRLSTENGHTYSHDPNGNRRSDQTGTTTSTYTYETYSNRLISATVPQTDRKGNLSYSTRNYLYDGNGNLTTDGTYTYHYNAQNRLSQVTLGRSTTVYSYNALGQRLSKTGRNVQSGANYFVYDEQGQLLGEYDSAGQRLQETLYLNDVPVAVIKPTGLYYLHPDHLNTVRVSTDTTGKVIWRWDSDAFGTTAPNENPDGDKTTFTYNLRFPGQYYDKESGLHYNYFRDYNPATGRYVQSDPIGLAGGLNTYTYVGGNPLYWVDLLGLDSLRFNGRSLIQFDTSGKAVQSWPAASGVVGSGPQDSYVKDYGPIPEGRYLVDPKKTNYDRWWKFRWGSNAAWGVVRTPIDPLPGTYTAGRNEMYIHGGSSPGSVGCVDLTSGNDDFHEWLSKQAAPVPLLVDYPGYQSNMLNK